MMVLAGLLGWVWMAMGLGATVILASRQHPQGGGTPTY